MYFADMIVFDSIFLSSIMSGSRDDLEHQLSELKDKHGQLESSCKKQREELENADKRRRELQTILEQTQGSKNDVSKMLQKLTDETKERTRKLRIELDRSNRELVGNLSRLAQSSSSNRKARDQLRLRYKVVKQQWEVVEAKYIEKISSYDQELVMIKAKINEVKHRLAVLAGPRPIPTPSFADILVDVSPETDLMEVLKRVSDSNLRGDSFFGGGLNTIRSDCEARKERIESAKQEIDELEAKCRDLWHKKQAIEQLEAEKGKLTTDK